MESEKLIAGIDIGSSQISCAAGCYNEEKTVWDIKGHLSLPCSGIKTGMIVDLQETAFTLEKAVKTIEIQANMPLNSAVLALRGSHIESVTAHGVLNINRTDKEITDEDVRQVLSNAEALRFSPDKEILYTSVQKFSLDKLKGISNPVGMKGNYLEVDVHILLGSSTYLDNLYKAVSLAGIDIEDAVYGLFALGDALIEPEEKDTGCLLVDIGGLTTGVVFYLEGNICLAKELPIGSDHITKDISHLLKIPHKKANEMKENHKKITTEVNQFLKRTQITNNVSKTADLNYAITARLDQIFSLVYEEVQKAGFEDTLFGSNVVLTGGGSKLDGILKDAETAFGTSARLGMPRNAVSATGIEQDVSYATAVSALCSSRGQESKDKFKKSFSKNSSLIHKILNWFEEAF